VPRRSDQMTLLPFTAAVPYIGDGTAYLGPPRIRLDTSWCQCRIYADRIVLPCDGRNETWCVSTRLWMPIWCIESWRSSPFSYLGIASSSHNNRFEAKCYRSR
jgi:hypothetical protein